MEFKGTDSKVRTRGTHGHVLNRHTVVLNRHTTPPQHHDDAHTHTHTTTHTHTRTQDTTQHNDTTTTPHGDRERQRQKQSETETEREERKRREKMKDIFPKNVSRPKNPPDELAQNVSKKNPLRTNYSSFSFESSESDRVFNYLHGSNSIFRAGEINSEWVFGRTVLE